MVPPLPLTFPELAWTSGRIGGRFPAPLMEDDTKPTPAPEEPTAAGADGERRRRRRGGRGRERGPRPEGETPTVTEGAPEQPQDWKPGEGGGESAETARPAATGEGERGHRREGGRRERERDGGGRREGERPRGERGPRPPREGERSGERGERGGERGERPRRGDRREGDRREGDRPRGPRGEKPAEGTGTGTPKPDGANTPSKPAAPKKIDFLAELGGTLLEGVSRSFYLTIKLLPEELRAPISLGYLLARASDSIADAALAAPAETRLEHLRAFAEMIKYGTDSQALGKLRKEIATRLPAESEERRLLEAAPQLLAWLESSPKQDQWELRRVLGRITYGQELDLVRFGDGGALKALADRGELLDYTYYVAGGVGEFWTELCAHHLGAKFSTSPREAMLPLGKRYGQGLQLINILRDLPEDLAAGRCYLPADELAAAGLTPDDLLSNPSKARAFVAQWRAEAVACLDDGWKYVQAVREWKLRYPIALPILIGLDTLALLASQPPLEQKSKVKVKRSSTAATLLKAKLGVISQAWLDGMYKRRRKKAS